MIRVAIVEDDNAEAELLIKCLTDYSKEISEAFQITHYKDAESFLQNYNAVFDIVFMDIELKSMNGIEAAFKLREIDKQIILIFVTNVAQFAVKGYEVDALDYILKPIKFERFKFKLQRAIEIIKSNREIELTVTQANGFIKISTKLIHYIEVNGHKLSYHTENGIVQGYGSLSNLERELRDKNFMRCNNCYLVNPRYIISIRGLNIIMRNGNELTISQPKRKKFLNDITDWLGQGNF